MTNPIEDLQLSRPSAKKTYVGDYIKIIAETEDHHREITRILTDKKLEYYAFQPVNNRPLTLVIKGLPVTTECDEIKRDISEKRIKVEKVVQMRQ
ncbi:hypothetical protein TNCV_3110331 [Trichonephila clavipes]|nr:hypothetical protein TNCV_3110331 [Trichonephila clavipes]